MNLKQKLKIYFKQKLIWFLKFCFMVIVIVGSTAIAIAGLYHLMSPYQRCVRTFSQELDLGDETIPKELVFHCMELTKW
jgi:hypothetical protein